MGELTFKGTPRHFAGKRVVIKDAGPKEKEPWPSSQSRPRGLLLRATHGRQCSLLRLIAAVEGARDRRMICSPARRSKKEAIGRTKRAFRTRSPRLVLPRPCATSDAVIADSNPMPITGSEFPA